MIDMSVNFCGISFKNPLIAASGCFGFGREYEESFDISKFGGISVKGLTLRPRAGNPPPRIAETPSGCLNSVGLQNPGVEAFLRDELPWLKTKEIVVLANIAAESVEEYGVMAQMLGDAVDLIEVNISCPNVQNEGMAFGVDAGVAGAVTAAVKRNARVPVCVKLSPNVTDIAAIARACAANGADALSLINTIVGMRIDIETRRPILHRNIGGLSGPAVFPVAVAMVNKVANAVDLPLCGMGGVTTGADIVEMMLAGATTVGMGAALFRDPYAGLRALHQAEAWCAAHNVTRLADLVGGVVLS